MAQQLHAVDKLYPGRCPTLDPKTYNRALSVRQIFLGVGVVRVIRKTRIINPCDGRLTLQPFGHSQGVLAMPWNAQVQRFDTH